MSETYTFPCGICGTVLECGNYGDVTCAKCGLEYRYDETQSPVLTAADWAAVYKARFPEWRSTE